jgi:hypothetical protein
MTLATMDAITSGVISGIVTAVILGFITWCWRQYREWRIKQLGDLMGKIIEHRNSGRRKVSDPDDWVRRAIELEAEAKQRAYKVSRASGLLVNWLGEIPSFGVDKKVKNKAQIHYVNMLTAVIDRIRDTLKRHDR